MSKHSVPRKRFKLRPVHAVIGLALSIMVTGAAVGVASMNNAQLSLNKGDSMNVKCIDSSLKFNRDNPSQGKVKCVPTSTVTQSSSSVPSSSTVTSQPSSSHTTTTNPTTTTKQSTSTT